MSHLEVTGSHLKVTGSWLKVTGSQLKVTGSHLKVTGSQLKVTRSHLKVTGNHCAFLLTQPNLRISKFNYQLVLWKVKAVSGPLGQNSDTVPLKKSARYWILRFEEFQIQSLKLFRPEIDVTIATSSHIIGNSKLFIYLLRSEKKWDG